ncbi:hypothetical protein ABPG72_007987 [Tetrahymena utriculariae]
MNNQLETIEEESKSYLTTQQSQEEPFDGPRLQQQPAGFQQATNKQTNETVQAIQTICSSSSQNSDRSSDVEEKDAQILSQGDQLIEQMRLQRSEGQERQKKMEEKIIEQEKQIQEMQELIKELMEKNAELQKFQQDEKNNQQ